MSDAAPTAKGQSIIPENIRDGMGLRPKDSFHAACRRNRHHAGEGVAPGAEVFHEKPSLTGRSASNGLNVGGIFDFTGHYHPLFSGGRGGMLYAVDAPAVGYPTTCSLAVRWTF